MTTSSLLESLQPFAMSLLIGLAAGIERERRDAADDSVMGMRTFALIAFLGAAVATVAVASLTLVVALFVAVMVVAGYWRSTYPRPPDESTAAAKAKHIDMGLTTEFAACLVFVLGYMTRQQPLLAGVLGILLVSILYFRRGLHWFARDVLRPVEIKSVLLLAAFVFVVIPFLPDVAIDPWHLIRPKKLAQVFAMIAWIQFFGYAAQRLAGARIGLLVTGFLGGLVSSTAVFFSLARAAKERPTDIKALSGAAMLAVAAPLLLFDAILAATSPPLMATVGVPALAAAIGAALLGVCIGGRSSLQSAGRDENRSPLDLRSILRLGAVISGLLVATSVARAQLGAGGVGLVSFVGGLFELHGVTLANATMHAVGTVSDGEAARGLLLAVGASLLSKLAISWALAPWRFAALVTLMGAVAVGFGAAAYQIGR